jgi:hypothetical protein
MKAALTFDVAQLRDYGPSTPSLRRLYVEWSDIDWFTPPKGAASTSRATRAFADHLRLGRPWFPERFPESVTVGTKVGTLVEFQSLCEQVRQPSDGDWKYGTLKQPSRRHSARCGWNQEEVGGAELEIGERPRPGDLWFRYRGRLM